MSKSYIYPPPVDHSADVLCAVPASLPCRVTLNVVKLFDLPVDQCAVDFATQLYSPELLELNPVHSLPFLLAYGDGDKVTCINGSEAIVEYLVAKYRAKVPESFLPGLDPLAKADVLQKSNFISIVAYRATMYQYVYPMLGLMTECQYDMCKRDFCLDQIEAWAKAADGPFFQGGDVSLADLYFYNLWLGNNWVSSDAFKELGWRHCDVIDRYPASKALIESVAALDGVKATDTWTCSDEARPEIQVPTIELVCQTGMFGVLQPSQMNKGRMFKQYGDQLHPNMVAYSEKKAEFDMPLR